MNRSEANKICVGDRVIDMFGRNAEVIDLEFTFTSDDESAILATLKFSNGLTIKQNLELCAAAPLRVVISETDNICQQSLNQ